jgi:hypothetical protein
VKEQLFVGTNDECFIFLLKHQGQSVNYALKYGGYAIKPVFEQVPVESIFNNHGLINEEAGFVIYAKNLITQTVANHVLAQCGDGKAYKAGSCYQHMIEAFLSADGENFRKLEKGFPEYAQAVFIYKNVENGYKVLEEIAGL